MNIRTAIPADADKIMQLLVQVNNVHSAVRPDLFIKDKTKYTVPRLIDIINNDKTPVFVADDNGEVKGYCFGILQSHENDNNISDITTFYIDDLCVDENCRGEHIGRDLYEYAVSFAKNSGCYNLTLNVWDGNDAAIKFYEKCGLKTQKYGLEAIL